jgi:hypothetical protein
MFSLIGVLLVGYGLISSAASVVTIDGQGININLIWGVVLLVFGVLMLLGAARGRNKTPPPA